MTSSAAAAAARATAAWRLFQGEADVKQVRPSILPGDATKISWESKAETSHQRFYEALTIFRAQNYGKFNDPVFSLGIIRNCPSIRVAWSHCWSTWSFQGPNSGR